MIKKIQDFIKRRKLKMRGCDVWGDINKVKISDPNKPCVAIRRGILDNKTPTECPFNDTPDWMEVI